MNGGKIAPPSIPYTDPNNPSSVGLSGSLADALFCGDEKPSPALRNEKTPKNEDHQSHCGMVIFWGTQHLFLFEGVGRICVSGVLFRSLN